MARRSKLSDKQWEEIQRRNLEGESLRSLAREFGIGESSARERISAQTAQIKTVAKQIVETNNAIKALPISAQVSAYNLADKMMAISMSLSDAAVASAATAKRINESTRIKCERMTDEELHDPDTIRSIMAAGMAANTHAKTGLDILTISSKSSALNNSEQPVVKTLSDFYGGNA